jgi:hypothetical protein
MTQTGAPLNVKAVGIGAPMGNSIGHSSDQPGIRHPAFQLDDPCDSAHILEYRLEQN